MFLLQYLQEESCTVSNRPDFQTVKIKGVSKASVVCMLDTVYIT